MAELETFEYSLNSQKITITKNDIKNLQNDLKILKLRINDYKTNIGNFKNLFTGLETIKVSRYEFVNNYFSFFYKILGVEMSYFSFIDGSIYKEGDEVDEAVSRSISTLIFNLIGCVQHVTSIGIESSLNK